MRIVKTQQERLEVAQDALAKYQTTRDGRYLWLAAERLDETEIKTNRTTGDTEIMAASRKLRTKIQRLINQGKAR